MNEDQPATAALSAQGTRPSRRGIDSRQRFIDQAIRTLSTGGPSVASVNLIAKQAGFSWGAVQHQFGDADGVWASVIDRMDASLQSIDLRVEDTWSVRRRVKTLIGRLWAGSERPEVRATENLRLTLPRSQHDLVRDFPKTEVALRNFDAEWERLWSTAFAGLGISPARLRRICAVVPGAMRGLRHDIYLTGSVEPDEGKSALIDLVATYLESDPDRPRPI